MATTILFIGTGSAIPASPPTVQTISDGQTATFLDQFSGRVFLTDTNVVKIGFTDKGEWRLTSPDGMVVYIARDTAGAYSYWTTSPVGSRFAAKGAVSQRGVSVCMKNLCQYWLTAADGSHHYVATQQRKDGSVKLYSFAPLIAPDSPAAKATRKLWESHDTNPSYLVWRERKQLADYLGFELSGLEGWVGGRAVAASPTMVAGAASIGSAALQNGALQVVVAPRRDAHVVVAAPVVPVVTLAVTGLVGPDLFTEVSPELVAQWGVLAFVTNREFEYLWRKSGRQRVDVRGAVRFDWAPGEIGKKLIHREIADYDGYVEKFNT